MRLRPDRRIAMWMSISGAVSLAAGLYGEALPLPREKSELASLLATKYSCLLRLEQGKASVSASCPEEGYFPVIRGPINTPINLLVDVLFLQRTARASRVTDYDSRISPSFAATDQIRELISTQAPDCKGLDFPKNARCAADEIAGRNHLRVGMGREKNGNYCESYYLADVPSLYPAEFCGSDVETGF